MNRPGPLTPLRDARDWLAKRLYEGADCPCCGRYAEIRKRPLYRYLMASLIHCYKEYGLGEFKSDDPRIANESDFVKLRFWGLVEEADPDAVREDGSSRTGWYRITRKGEDFIYGRVKVEAWLKIFNNEVRERSEEMVGIHDRLPKKYDYRAMLDV